MHEVTPGKAQSWAVGVVVPARNEQDSIVACLDSILSSLDDCAEVHSSWIVVVADSCRDRTASLARQRLAGRGTVIACSAASPGVARRLGAADVLARFQTYPASRVWIANTDADSRVSSDWISRQLQLASSGYCGVAGIVRIESLDDQERAAARLLLDEYITHKDGTHPHVHGANLGIRADAYVDAGCWSSLNVAEDHCLWARVKARGWRIVSTVHSVVLTSGRLQGRARGGFADALRRRLGLLYA